jgi:transcriptional regulator with XRE-family HTH domain
MSSAWFSKVKQGQRPATLDFLRGIAGALQIEPERFIEYRLAVARRQLDEREVGLEEAVRALERYEGGEDSGSIAQPGVLDPDSPPGRAAAAAKQAKDEMSRQQGSQPSRRRSG